MNASVLLLNADAQPLSLLPLSTISWQQAIKTIFSDRAHVIKEYDNLVLRSSRLTIPVPSIIMYHNYHKSPSRAKYNRKNLYIRVLLSFFSLYTKNDDKKVLKCSKKSKNIHILVIFANRKNRKNWLKNN